MLIGRIAGATRVLGKSQGYLGLPIRDVVVRCSTAAAPVPAMKSVWFPTPDELARLNAGAGVELMTQGTAHPPVIMAVGEAPEAPESGTLS